MCCVKGALARGVSERRAYLVNVETSDAQSRSIFETCERSVERCFHQTGRARGRPRSLRMDDLDALLEDLDAAGIGGGGAARPRASAGARLRPSAGPPPSPARQRHGRRSTEVTASRAANTGGNAASRPSGNLDELDDLLGELDAVMGTGVSPLSQRPKASSARRHHHHQNLIIAHPPRSRPINPRRPMRTPRAYPRPWTGAATAATAAAAAARHSWPTSARRRRAAGSTGALHART